MPTQVTTGIPIAVLLVLLELQLAYQESISKHGSVAVEVTQCVFVGSTAVGKSSLKHLLVHNTPKAVKESTAVMDTPEVVTVSSEQYAVEGGTSAWQLVSDDVMAKSLHSCISNRAYDDNPQYPSEAEVNESKSPNGAEVNRSEHVHSSPHGQGDTLLLPLQAIPPHQQQHSKDRGSGPQLDINSLLKGHYSQLLQEMGEDGERIQLKDTSFIYLLDTGGQPSFQVILPLLLDAPCTYIQVFNAARDLDQIVPITYRHSDHTEVSLPPSNENSWQLMLRSFSSMQTMAHKCSKELFSLLQDGSSLPQLCIFVVGTFKDELMTKGRHDEARDSISRKLEDLNGKPYYDSLKWDPDGWPFYLINCMADNEDEKVCINSLRRCLSNEGSSLKLNVPVMWYMFQQVTQRVPLKFFKFNDLKDFCLKRKFIDASNADSQFRSLLKLFSLLGFYSFFNLKGIPDEDNYICTDRGVFLKEVSKLLAVQFTSPKSSLMSRFKKTGTLVFTPELFKELDTNPSMNLHWFMNALCQLGIAAHLPERPEYFIPAALPHTSVRQEPVASVPPLCFTYKMERGPIFSCSDLPQGVFCHLAVELIQQKWTIIPEKSTRTQLKFHWKEFDIVLQEFPGYISLIPQVVEEFSTLSELHVGCEELCRTVTKCLSHSTESVLGSHFSTVAEIVVGFECPCNEANMQRHLALPSDRGKSLICNQTSSRQVYSKPQRIWKSTVDGAVVSIT